MLIIFKTTAAKSKTDSHWLGECLESEAPVWLKPKLFLNCVETILSNYIHVLYRCIQNWLSACITNTMTTEIIKCFLAVIIMIKSDNSQSKDQNKKNQMLNNQSIMYFK